MVIDEKELQLLDINPALHQKIFLMGRIEHICQIADWLRTQGLLVKAILDNDPAKQGTYAGGLPIVSPRQALLPFQKDVFVIIYSPKYWEDMCAQLAEYGYREGRYVHVLDRPSLHKNIRLVKEGFAVYRKLQREYGEDVFVFLANCPLGDYYLLGLYFRQYCEEHRIKNYLIAGMSRGIETLSPWFGFHAVRRLSGEESGALIRAWMFLGSEVIRMKPLTIWQGAFRFNPCQTRQKDGFSFLDTFTSMIYALENPIPWYPPSAADGAAMETLFREKGLRPRRTVIFSPFAYSMRTLPSGFWVGLAEALEARGYTVAVNVGEERERNFIPDTVTLRLEFPEMMSAMELAGTVVGMRSGFFDITARARCRRIVLYPPSVAESVVWNSTNIEFCGLKRMGLCGDAYEWTAEDPEEIQKRILAILCTNIK